MTGVLQAVGRMRRGAVTIWLMPLVVCVLLAACEAPPTADQIRADVGTALNNGTPPELLSLETINVTDAKRVTEGHEVTFTADLRLHRDHTFTDWNQFNVASLAHVFGTAPWEVNGVNPHGNVTDDLISLEGHATYAAGANGHGWVLRYFGPTPPLANPTRPRLRDQVWAVGRALFASPDTWRVVRENFVWAFTRSRAQLARAHGGWAIAGGALGSDGWTIVEAMRNADAPHLPVVNLIAADNTDALRQLRDGTASAAIIDSDRAAQAMNAMPDLRAIGALFPKPLHVIVNADSKIASIVDLRGKHLAIAEAPNRVAENALKVYRLSGAAVSITTLALPAALAALTNGSVDAVMTTAPAPQDEIANAGNRRPIRLLGLDSDAIALLTTGEDRYLAFSIPAHAYPGQPNPIATVAVVATLMTTLSVGEDEVSSLRRAVFGKADYLHTGSIAEVFVNPDAAQRGLNIPLYPAAKAEESNSER